MKVPHLLTFTIWIISYSFGLVNTFTEHRPLHGYMGAISSLSFAIPIWAVILRPSFALTLMEASVAIGAIALVIPSAQTHYGGLRYWSWTHEDRLRFNNVNGNDIVNYDTMGMLYLFVLTSALALERVSQTLAWLRFQRFGVPLYVTIAIWTLQINMLLDESEPPKDSQVMFWIISFSGVAIVSCLGVAIVKKTVTYTLSFIVHTVGFVSTSLAYNHVGQTVDWTPGEPILQDALAVAWHTQTALIICVLLLITTPHSDNTLSTSRIVYYGFYLFISLLQWSIFVLPLSVFLVLCICIIIVIFIAVWKIPNQSSDTSRSISGGSISIVVKRTGEIRRRERQLFQSRR